MYGYIYETTNLINGKKYIGKKTSNKLDTNYLGSGIYLKRAVEKYGKENFSIKILEEINTNQEDLCNREIYWINYYNAVSSNNYYNIGAGGIGWNNSVNSSNKNYWLGRHHSKETKQKMSNSKKGKPWTEAQRKALLPTRQGKNNPMYGKHRIIDDITKNKISNSLKGKRLWVSTDLDNKFILKEDLDYYLMLGYKLGRNKSFRDKVSKNTKEAMKNIDMKEICRIRDLDI